MSRAVRGLMAAGQGNRVAADPDESRRRARRWSRHQRYPTADLSWLALCVHKMGSSAGLDESTDARALQRHISDPGTHIRLGSPTPPAHSTSNSPVKGPRLPCRPRLRGRPLLSSSSPVRRPLPSPLAIGNAAGLRTGSDAGGPARPPWWPTPSPHGLFAGQKDVRQSRKIESISNPNKTPAQFNPFTARTSCRRERPRGESADTPRIPISPKLPPTHG